jgi:hypothetical protein
MALAADASSRVWAVWSQGGAVHVRRSRSDGRHFGAPASATFPGTVYQVSAIALADGRVDVFASDGGRFFHQVFRPALTVKATRRSVSVLDDGIGVKATLKGGGRTATTSAAGTASLVRFRRGTRVSVVAAGYAATSFKVP